MITKIALIGTVSLLAISVAAAQNAPPPGNVNPGSMKSGAEPSGTENQPRSKSDQMGAPTGGQVPAPATRMQQESSPDSTAGGAAGTSKGNSKPQ